MSAKQLLYEYKYIPLALIFLAFLMLMRCLLWVLSSLDSPTPLALAQIIMLQNKNMSFASMEALKTLPNSLCPFVSRLSKKKKVIYKRMGFCCLHKVTVPGMVLTRTYHHDKDTHDCEINNTI